jgi:flagellar hook protein FlgE
VVGLFKQTSNIPVSLFQDYNLTTTPTTINISASGTTQVPVSIHADTVSIFQYSNPVYSENEVFTGLEVTTENFRLPTDDQTVSIGTAFEGVTSDTQTIVGDNFFRVSQPNTIPLKAIQVSLCSGGQSTLVTLFALTTSNDPNVAGYLMANKDGTGAVNGTVTNEIIVPKFDVSIWSTSTVSIAANWSEQSIVTNVEYTTDPYTHVVVSIGTPTPFQALQNLRATTWADVVDSVTGSATVDLPTGITPDNSTKVIINNRVGTTETASFVAVTDVDVPVVTDGGTVTVAGVATPCVSVYNP